MEGVATMQLVKQIKYQMIFNFDKTNPFFSVF